MGFPVLKAGMIHTTTQGEMQMKAWKWVCVVVALAVLSMFLGGNTFRGLGQDIEGAGKVIQKGATKPKEAVSK
jgi:predicted small secreted protein